MAEPISVPQPVAVPEAPVEQPVAPLPSPVNQELQQPQPAAAAPRQQSWLGKAAQALFSGNDVSYNYDDTGKLVETRTPMKKGQIFRNMLAGALLGGAIGSQDQTKTFAGGAVTGAAGVRQHDEQMDILKRKQAQEAYDMRLKGVASGREEQKLGIEKDKLELEKREQKNKETLTAAQTAMYNSEVLRNNTLTQGATLDQHLKMKTVDATDLEVFKSMGLQPSFTATENEISDLLKKRPDAMNLMWKVSDVRMGLDAQGNPDYQYVYEGYDLKKDIPITEPTLKLWKQAGLNKSYPEIFKLKPGTKISANNYKAFQQMALASLNTSLEKQKAEVDIALKEQQIKESQARAIKDLADAKRETTALKKDHLFGEAMDAYGRAGKDITKVDAKYQGIIAEHAGKLATSMAPLYKQAVETGQNEVAQGYAQKIKDLTDLSEAAFKKTVDITKLPRPTSSETAVTSAAGQAAFLRYKAEFGNSDAAVSAMLQNGWSMPPATPPEPGILEKAGAAAGKVGGAVVDFFKQRSILPNPEDKGK